MKLKLTRMRKKAGHFKRRLLQWFEKSLARKAPGLLLELFPSSALIIEPTNICNLRCPLSYSAFGQDGIHRQFGQLYLSWGWAKLASMLVMLKIQKN